MPSLHVELASIDLPEFGLPTVEPSIPASVYEARMGAFQSRITEAGLDAVLVYGDREHYANLAYLTGFDPRYEEGMLVVVSGHKPALLVGNEGLPYAQTMCPLDVDHVLFQSFSLVSQPRDVNPPLKRILSDAGIQTGQKVGVIGWKYFIGLDTDEPQNWIEAPAYIVDTLRGLGCSVSNATALLMHPTEGLRAINELEQLAWFEMASTFGSQSLRHLLFHVEPGMTEFEAMHLHQWIGLPLNSHPAMMSGERTRFALAGASMRKLQVGDPIFASLGYWGCNNARGGFLVENADQLPINVRDYVDKLVVPYFRAVVDWYQHIGIGVTGGELYEVVHQHIGDPFFGVSLNPGHLIHLDEWVSSPVYKGSTETLRSGMAIQVDIIPATGTEYHTSNIEDGIALADESLQAEFAQKYPEAWGRIQGRRDFMQNVLGIELKPEVLPFSNIPAYLPPYWLARGMAMRVGS
jgi:hypothetical protein